MSIDGKSARRWHTAQQAAADILHIAEGTLCKYVKLGIGPRSVKIGNGRRFHDDWLGEWILEGGVTRPDRARILRAANKARLSPAMEDEHMSSAEREEEQVA